MIDDAIDILWVDPGVTTGFFQYTRRRQYEHYEFDQVEGLEGALRHIKTFVMNPFYGDKVLGYESFYIAARTLTVSPANRESALDIIGWIEGESALNRMPEVVSQKPSERTPKIITKAVVQACINGPAPVGTRHSLDAARHWVRFMVSNRKDEMVMRRYGNAT